MPSTPFYRDRPLIFAHRGARDVAPENTLAAFDAAIQAGADGIELDVRRCRTGEVVVMHDEVVDRTTNGSGRVETISLEMLRLLDAGSWFAQEFRDERIPTLAETLDLVGHRLLVNIEIKATRLRSDGLEAEVVQLVRERDMQDRVIISSFNPAVLIRLKRLAPELPRGLLYAPDLPVYLSRAWAVPLIRPCALHPHYSMVTEHSVREARRAGYRVNAWTVNEDHDMMRLINLGVDGIITDHPGRLYDLLLSDEALNARRAPDSGD